MVRERAAERLGDAGFDDVDVERILDLVPLATHNQRGRGTLYLGTELRLDAQNLVGIIERSMSSPIYELLKRSPTALRRRARPPRAPVRRGLGPSRC